MIINQLSNQHKTYTLFTNGNECAFSTTGIDNNVIKLEGSGSYYTNTTDNKEISIKSIVDKTFVVFSDSLKNEWDLYFDETIEVLGKKCTKAVYKKNRSVVAWFCQEIPSPVGPCGYIGLPGAILRLTTSSEIYEAESILPIKGQVKIELPRGKIMQKPAFEKLQKKKIEELKESGNDNVIVFYEKHASPNIKNHLSSYYLKVLRKYKNYLSKLTETEIDAFIEAISDLKMNVIEQFFGNKEHDWLLNDSSIRELYNHQRK